MCHLFIGSILEGEFLKVITPETARKNSLWWPYQAQCTIKVFTIHYVKQTNQTPSVCLLWLFHLCVSLWGCFKMCIPVSSCWSEWFMCLLTSYLPTQRADIQLQFVCNPSTSHDSSKMFASVLNLWRSHKSRLLIYLHYRVMSMKYNTLQLIWVNDDFVWKRCHVMVRELGIICTFNSY